MSKKTDTKDIILPFSEKEFIDAWADWLKYRSERRLGAYTPTGLTRTFKRLLKDCGGDCALAVEMIDYAMSKTWQGIYPIKPENNGNTNIPSSAAGNKEGSVSRARIQAAKNF